MESRQWSHFWISRKWLQLDSEQIQDLLLLLGWLGDLLELDAGNADLLLANAPQMFVIAFSVLAFVCMLSQHEPR
jgi:hypothetical protein